MTGMFKECDEHYAAEPVGISVHYKSMAKISSLRDKEFTFRFELPLTEGTKKFILAFVETDDEKTKI